MVKLFDNFSARPPGARDSSRLLALALRETPPQRYFTVSLGFLHTQTLQALEKWMRIVIDCARGMRDALGVKIISVSEHDSEAVGASELSLRLSFDA